MTTYTICMESVPEIACMAHVAELPGCHTLASGERAALAALPAVIERHRAWRQAHGLSAGGDNAVTLTVAQVINGPRPWQLAGASALFSLDRRILDDGEIAEHLRLLACARADMLRGAHAVPRGAYDEALPAHPRTLRQLLTHLADTEVWLLSRLGRRVAVAEPDPLRRLIDVRARALEHITRYDREDRDLVFVPTAQPSEDPDEMWTLRKLLRRMIEHELAHLEDMDAAVAHWSQSGAE